MTQAGGPEVGNGLDNLTNYNYPGILYSIGCDNAPFDVHDPHGWHPGRNMAEGFTVITKAGGIAFLGNSRLGWVSASSTINRYFLDLISTGNSYLHLGVSELISKYNYTGSFSHYLSYSHNLVGCPETEMWINTPSQFTSPTVTDGGSYITVNAGISGSTINVRSVDGGAAYDLTASDVTSYTFNTSVRPLIITVNKSQYLPYTAITGGTINTDVTIWGKLHVLGNLTIDVGDNLTLEPGTILSFSGNYSLISYGGLTAIGTPTNPVTFTSTTGSSPNSWGTITLNGSFASGSTISNAKLMYGTQISAINVPQFEISNSNFTDNYKAVYVSGSTGSILNNTITSNSTGHVIELVNWSTVTCAENDITKTNRRGCGILYGGGATGIVSNNDIEGCDWGIGAIWSSSPYATSSFALERNNRITNCNYGLKVYRLSYPLFGYGAPSDEMWNSIYGNTFNAAVATSYTTYQSGLTAYGNWWGSYPPNSSLIVIGSNGWINYLPGLQYDPWQGIPKTNSNEATADIGVENILDKGIDDLLFPGINLRLQNKYNEAKNFFISHLLKNPGDQQAYVELYNCYCEETSNDIIVFFNSLPKGANNDHKLLLAYLFLKENDIENAKKVNNNIITENPNTSLSIRAKINNLYIALYNENDIEKALTLLAEIKNKPALSISSEIAQVQEAVNIYTNVSLGEVVDNSIYKSSFELNGKQNAAQVQEYTLFGNYPNPFNPSTAITYNLPRASAVTITIFDILGNKIRSISNSSQSAGIQSIVWNGTNNNNSQVASGLYLYHFKAVSLEGKNEIFESTGKLLLLK